jgi:hypothetical protein
VRVLVCGSRHWEDRALLELTLSALASGATIIHGDCLTGADAMADRWARNTPIGWKSRVIERFPADWKKYGGRAGPIRNQQMIDTKPDLVIAFGSGRGTDDCVRRAEKAGISVRRIP